MAALSASAGASLAFATPVALPNPVGDGLAQFTTDEFGCRHAGMSTSFDPLGATYGDQWLGGNRAILLRSVDGTEVFAACSYQPYASSGVPYQTDPASLDEMIGPDGATRHSRYLTYNDKLEVELFQSSSCATLTQHMTLTNVFDQPLSFHLAVGGDTEVEWEDNYAGDVPGGLDPNTSYVYDRPGSAIRAGLSLFGGNILGWRGYVDPAGGVAYEANFFAGYPADQAYNTSYRNTVGNTPGEFDPANFVDDDLDNNGVSDTIGDSAQGVITAIQLAPGESVALRIVNSLEPAACNLEPNAGPDQAVAITAQNLCANTVDLDGTATVTSSGASYAWFEAGAQIATGASTSVALEPGAHVITLKVCDNVTGSCAYDEVIIEVASADPVCTCGSDDCDGDGLDNATELALGTDPLDGDSDDDGVLDGVEPNPGLDTDGDGLVNAIDPDSDNDGLLDGTELGVTTAGPDTDLSVFVPDADPATTTNPLDSDTDGGGVSDGDEDANHDGAIDSGETDPNDPADDQPVTPTPPDDGGDSDGDGFLDDAHVQGGKLGCQAGQDAGAAAGGLALLCLGALAARRRQDHA